MAVSLFDQWWRIILYLVIYTSCCALYLISKQSNCFELCPPCIEYWLGCKFKKKLEKSRSHIANSFVLRFKQAIVLLLLLILSDPLHPAFLSNCDKLERMLWFGIVVELWWVSNCVKTLANVVGWHWLLCPWLIVPPLPHPMMQTSSSSSSSSSTSFNGDKKWQKKTKDLPHIYSNQLPSLLMQMCTHANANAGYKWKTLKEIHAGNYIEWNIGTTICFYTLYYVALPM